ncbi:MAG: ABC transporter permease [Schleiferiaceae bacterium]|nr:ABC transporter permease [Schleiferiaceae bacterium]
MKIQAKYINNFNIALEAIMANKLRSLLTGLGIIFGVAAVITMIAIGRGAKQEILSQLELIGVNNIVVTPIFEQEEGETSEEETDETKKKTKRFSKGLDLKDVESIEKVLPNIKATSPEIVFGINAIYDGKFRSTKLIGVASDYFSISNIEIHQGEGFSQYQHENAQAVCIIGSGIEKKLFTGKDPIGEFIKCGEKWLKVVGVTKEKVISDKSMENLGIRNYNMDIYTPINTLLVRYENRGILAAERANSFSGDGFFISEEADQTIKNYHQIDRLVVQVVDAEQLSETADIVNRMLKRKHNNVVDYEISIPIQLLQQQQDTKEIFNFVLSAIAGISLLVGGIGIMNIMLASVLERTKEIGTRLAIGAKKADIINQFLFESVLISLSGGLIGVILGVLASYFVSTFADIETVVSYGSVFLAFGVATGIGLIFGISPAKKAAQQNPIESLRYE